MQRKVAALLGSCACHRGPVACLWQGPPGKEDVGAAALLVWLSAAGPVMSVWGAPCDLWIALASPHNASLQKKRLQITRGCGTGDGEQREFLKSASFC